MPRVVKVLDAKSNTARILVFFFSLFSQSKSWFFLLLLLLLLFILSCLHFEGSRRREARGCHASSSNGGGGGGGSTTVRWEVRKLFKIILKLSRKRIRGHMASFFLSFFLSFGERPLGCCQPPCSLPASYLTGIDAPSPFSGLRAPSLGKPVLRCLKVPQSHHLKWLCVLLAFFFFFFFFFYLLGCVCGVLGARFFATVKKWKRAEPRGNWPKSDWYS